MAAKKETTYKIPMYRKIVNVFIGFLVGIVILSLIFVGFSQTHTFREILKDKIISEFNSSTNGTLTIDRIEGTILTSIFIRNLTVEMGNDTLVYAGKIEIKTSPLQLLLRKIYFRRIAMEDVDISIQQDSNRVWNLSALAKPSEPDTLLVSASDNKGSGLYFAIQVNELFLKNINLRKQTYEHHNSKENYMTINSEDLRIDNVVLDASLIADMHKGNYNLILNQLSGNPNFTRFKLNELSGKFEITKDYASVNGMTIATDSSYIKLDARMDEFNLFGRIKLEDFKEHPIEVQLSAQPFNFDDLSSFLEAIEILKGRPEVYLKAQGKFGDFQIEQFSVDYLDTRFDMTGRIRELHRPEHIYINAKIADSYADYENVNQLLPTLPIPRYKNLKVESFSAVYDGEPLKYTAEINGIVGNGKLQANCFMDLESEPMIYKASFKTNDANLFPIIGTNTKVNSRGTINGVGTNPENLNTKFNCTIRNSEFGDFQIDSLKLNSHAANKLISIGATASVNNSTSNMTADLNFTNPQVPAYRMEGSIADLDLRQFFKDEKLSSDLNFDFNFDWQHYDLDTLTGDFSIDMKNSVFNEKHIDTSHLGIRFTGDNNSRNIQLESDIADINIEGSFPISKAIDLITYESKIIPDIISDKVIDLNPLYEFDQANNPFANDLLLPNIINTPIDIKYSFEFKDVELISTFVNLKKFEMYGKGNGEITNRSDNFSIAANLDLDYILTSDGENTFYISDFFADLNFSRNNQTLSFDNIFGTLSVSGEKIYTGVEFNNIFADLTFNQSKLFINIFTEAENSLKSEIDGYMTMSPNTQEIFLDKVRLEYKNIGWKNDSPIHLIFTPENLIIKNFMISHDASALSIEGTVSNRGSQDVKLLLSDLSGSILTNYLGINDPLFSAQIGMTANFAGSFNNPVIDINMEVDSTYYGYSNIGHLVCDMDYSDKILNTNLVFLDSTMNYSSPNLTLKGKLPINLSFGSVDNRLIEDSDVSIELLSEHLDLSSLGNILPGIINQTGYLFADVKVTGPYGNLERKGQVIISDATFRSTDNNLDYKYNMTLGFDNNRLLVDNIELVNTGSVPNYGALKGKGFISFDGFTLDNIDMKMNGNIALLGKNSAAVSPAFYGDLFVSTDGALEFSYRNKKPFIKGAIKLLKADITYLSDETAMNFTNNNFVYNIVIDTTQFERKELEFQRALQAMKSDNKYESSFAKTFDAEIDIKIVNDAKLEFILSKVANQKLIVEAQGDFRYESYDGISNVQGQINLLSGSKLEFIKTFEAAGLIRFESDITDPYLDIVAKYTAGYQSAEEGGKTEDVAVKIFLKGTLSKLGENMANNPDNIAVYIGSRNIENNIPDKRYDASDAFSFIFVGKFKEDLTTTDRTQVASQTAVLNNTAASFLGSVLSGYVNSAVGDVINNIQLSQSGQYTKFSVSGKFENLRYRVGGTTKVFQDINKANIKLEYLFNPNFLIRLERKDPLVQSFGIDEKINELGLKYRFEF